MGYGLSVGLGFVLGALPLALWVAARHGVDLRLTGDGNPGAWNALEQLGARRAWPAFAGDGLKGTLAGAAGWALTGEVWGADAGVAGAMLGHAFSPWLRGRGGKAVMTFAGGMFAVALVPAALALAACVGVALATRSFALGARVGVFGFPLVQLALEPAREVAATGGLMCLIGALFLVRSGARATPARA